MQSNKGSIAAVAEKAGIERKTIYNNPPLLNWLQTQITLQGEQKKARLEVAAASVTSQMEELPTNSLKKIQSLRERLKAEREKNQILVGKMAELKLEQQMYKQRIADLEEFIAGQREKQIRRMSNK